MRGLSTTGNKTELVLTIEEANTDGSWLRNCENNNPLLQEAYEQSQRFEEERNEMAKQIEKLRKIVETLRNNSCGGDNCILMYVIK